MEECAGHLSEDKGQITKDKGAQDQVQFPQDKGQITKDKGTQDQVQFPQDKGQFTQDTSQIPQHTKRYECTTQFHSTLAGY